MFFRQFLNDETACASYLLGCNSAGELAVVDAHADLVDAYIAAAEAQGSQIVAVLETHVQADHLSGLPELVNRTGAVPYLPEGAGVEFDHHPLADGELVKLGNTVIQALATPGHAGAPLTGRLLVLPDHILLYPGHYSGSVCGRGLSGNPASTIGFERRHNSALAFGSEDAFVAALTRDIPPVPEHQATMVAANRNGRPLIETV